MAAYPQRLVVLMAKSAGCRPCKAFARKYQRIAALYPDAVFTVITGDESKETRAMMMAMKVGLFELLREKREEREREREREKEFFSFAHFFSTRKNNLKKNQKSKTPGPSHPDLLRL